METKIKRVIALAVFFTVMLLAMLYMFVLKENIASIFILTKEIESKTLIHETQVENYINIKNNKMILSSLNEKNTKEIVSFYNLPYAMVSVSNLMQQNNIAENKFNIGHRQSVNTLKNVSYAYNEFFLVPLNISGVGYYQDISSYLNSLNYSNNFFLIDRLNIIQTQEEGLFYLDLYIFILVGDTYK